MLLQLVEQNILSLCLPTTVTDVFNVLYFDIIVGAVLLTVFVTFTV